MIAEALRRAHPLHALRKLRFFQKISQRFDPMMARRFSIFPHPIYLRAFSHGSMLLGANDQENSIHGTFISILRAWPAERRATFWDVGANIGYFSWLCAAVRPDSEIVSFEPDPRNVECLERTSRRWHLAQHKILRVAVAQSSGEAKFFRDKLAGATGTLETPAESFNARHYGFDSEPIDVKIISLDDFMKSGATVPAIIKIDVEGAEARVFDGARDLLARYAPILFFETFEHRAEIEPLLEANGYRSYDADRRAKVTAETINFVALVPERSADALRALREAGYPA